MNTDVLIVGAGPTGLMFANQLARRGVRVLIIDRRSGPARETRALGVQARTLEIYEALGIVDRALELGRPATGANLWANGRRTGLVPLGDAGRDVTAYPYIFILGQDDNELILGERLRACGVSVQWNTELIALDQHADHVVATLRGTDGSSRTMSAAWVGGCDGAHSAVRQLSGIEFPGAPYEHVFFVADVTATGTMVPGELNVYLWQAGFHLFFPMKGTDHWRMVGIVPLELRGLRGLTLDAVMPSVRKELDDRLVLKACSWFSTYRIHHRSAARFRDRRCFLMGDAAHIHSPVGAQGMNTGLQDAYNLAWKVAMVVKGQADDSLLGSYEEERIPIARRLLATTDRAFRLVVSDSWLAGIFRTQVAARVAAFAMRRKRVQRTAFSVVSQTGIHYRNSRISETLAGVPADAPRAGDRFPWLKIALDDSRFNLLVFGQPMPASVPLPLGDLLHVAMDPAADAEVRRARIPLPSFYLVRPDGHIGLCGRQLDLEALKRYVSRHFRA